MHPGLLALAALATVGTAGAVVAVQAEPREDAQGKPLTAQQRAQAAARRVGETAKTAGQNFLKAKVAGLSTGAAVGGGLGGLFGIVGGPVQPLIALSGVAVGANGGGTMAGTAAALIGAGQIGATAAAEAYSMRDLLSTAPWRL